jgi:hypothetical protein
MKWEHKAGIGITCTFLCLIGAVIGLKMQEQTTPESPTVAAADPGEPTPSTPEPKSSISFESDLPPFGSSPPAPGENASDDDPHPQGLAGRVPTHDKTKENEPSGKKATKSGKDDDPAPSAGAKGTPIVSAAPSPPVEPPPTARAVKGADEWGKSSSKSKEQKPNPAPAAPINDPKSASPSLPLTPEVNKPKPPNQPAPSMIVPAGGSIEPATAPMEPQKPVATSPPPPAAPPSTSLGTVSPPTPPAAANSTNSATQPELALPSYFAQQPTNAPKAPDPKEKDKPAPLVPTPATVKQPEMPALSAPPAQMPATAPAVTPAIVPPTPASPPPPPAPPAPTSPPPLMPTPSPVIISGPTFTPTPAYPASPPPPKAPADGSSFIPDNPPAASGPVGVRPAPLPLPVPPSSPLASAPEKPVAPQVISYGPSVTVYDEQDYSCRPGDTWEKISKQFYMTERYAKALQRHNQNHARASDRIKDNGQLAPGERIFVPQSYVLEHRYADVIPIPAAAPASTATPVVYPSGSPTTPPAPLPHP